MSVVKNLFTASVAVLALVEIAPPTTRVQGVKLTLKMNDLNPADAIDTSISSMSAQKVADTWTGRSQKEMLELKNSVNSLVALLGPVEIEQSDDFLTRFYKDRAVYLKEKSKNSSLSVSPKVLVSAAVVAYSLGICKHFQRNSLVQAAEVILDFISDDPLELLDHDGAYPEVMEIIIRRYDAEERKAEEALAPQDTSIWASVQKLGLEKRAMTKRGLNARLHERFITVGQGQLHRATPSMHSVLK